MKYVDEYRDGSIAQKYAAEIARITTLPWSIMEICGGQTHSIVKYGIDKLLPLAAQLLAGMLANPHIGRAYSTENGKLSHRFPGFLSWGLPVTAFRGQKQQDELVTKAIALAESLVEETETRIEEHLKHDFLWEEHNNEISA